MKRIEQNGNIDLSVLSRLYTNPISIGFGRQPLQIFVFEPGPGGREQYRLRTDISASLVGFPTDGGTINGVDPCRLIPCQPAAFRLITENNVLQHVVTRVCAVRFGSFGLPNTLFNDPKQSSAMSGNKRLVDRGVKGMRRGRTAEATYLEPWAV